MKAKTNELISREKNIALIMQGYSHADVCYMLGKERAKQIIRNNEDREIDNCPEVFPEAFIRGITDYFNALKTIGE